MKFATESGSTYEIKDGKVRRTREDDDGELRNDGEWVKLIETPRVVEGESVSMILVGIAPDGVYTIRRTTPVTEVTS